MRDVGGWSLIFWRPACILSLEKGFVLDDADLVWLRAALDAAAYPSVVFLHVPIDDHSMTGNYYFENLPHLSTYSNASQARRMIEASGKVVLAMSGHVHWNAGSTIGGIHYRTLAALADTFHASGEASLAWGVLDLGGDRLSLEVFGREPCSWAAAPRASADRWYAPLQPAAFERRMRVLWHEIAE